MIEVCKPGDDIHDMSREAKDLENLQGLPDRRHEGGLNGGTKQTLALIVALVVGMIIPNIIGLTSGTAVSSTMADRNEGEIEELKQRTFALEAKMGEGGRWTSEKQMTYAIDTSDRIAKIEAFDSAIGQELKDIRTVLSEIQTSLREMDRRTRDR